MRALLLPAPDRVAEVLPLRGTSADALVHRTRCAWQQIVRGVDKRMAVEVGGVTSDDPSAVLQLASRLADVRRLCSDSAELVMRVTLSSMPQKVVAARILLLRVLRLGTPLSVELRDPLSLAYLADLASVARVSGDGIESQVHREWASGMRCPVGFLCAGTRLQQALEAAHAAANAQSYMAIAPSGGIATFETTGNPDGFVVLQAPVAGELLFSRPTAVLLDCGTDLSRRLSARNSVTEGPARGCGTVIGFAAEGLGRARWIDDLVQTLQVLPPAVVRGGLNAVDLL